MEGLSAEVEIGIFLLAHTIVLLVAMVTAYVKIQVALAKCEIGVKHVGDTTDRIEASYEKLSDKVDGISRVVTKLEHS